MDTAADSTAMGRAITLAARGLGSTSPNPVVGCVILDAEGRPAGEGFHQRAGGRTPRSTPCVQQVRRPVAAPRTSLSSPVTTPVAPAPAPRR